MVPEAITRIAASVLRIPMCNSLSVGIEKPAPRTQGTRQRRQMAGLAAPAPRTYPSVYRTRSGGAPMCRSRVLWYLADIRKFRANPFRSLHRDRDQVNLGPGSRSGLSFA